MGIRHRRFAKALRNAGFSAIVSARALIILAPILGSFVQDGIRPQRIGTSAGRFLVCHSVGRKKIGRSSVVGEDAQFADQDAEPLCGAIERVWGLGEDVAAAHGSGPLSYAPSAKAFCRLFTASSSGTTRRSAHAAPSRLARSQAVSAAHPRSYRAHPLRSATSCGSIDPRGARSLAADGSLITTPAHPHCCDSARRSRAALRVSGAGDGGLEACWIFCQHSLDPTFVSQAAQGPTQQWLTGGGSQTCTSTLLARINSHATMERFNRFHPMPLTNAA
jgi:hypothetical protein